MQKQLATILLATLLIGARSGPQAQTMSPLDAMIGARTPQGAALAWLHASHVGQMLDAMGVGTKRGFDGFTPTDVEPKTPHRPKRSVRVVNGAAVRGWEWSGWHGSASRHKARPSPPRDHIGNYLRCMEAGTAQGWTGPRVAPPGAVKSRGATRRF